MNIELKKLFSDLDKYSDFSIPENELHFTEIFSQIPVTRDPEAIAKVLDYFDDDNGEDLACESLTQFLLFNVTPDDFVPVLLKKIPDLLVEAPCHCMDLIEGVLDNKHSSEVFRKNIGLADSAAMKKLLNLLENDKYCRHPTIIQDLKRQLEIM
jgi:hypothetical protein